MSGPLVIVDDREPSNAVDRLQAYGLQAISGRLEAGDYTFYPHGLTAIIERKTISNLLQSLSDKQMVAQAHRMVDIGDISFLLREGAFRRSPGGAVEYYSPKDPRQVDSWVLSGWSWDSFQGMMLDLQLMGIRITDCPVLGEYPSEVARLVINLSKDEHRWIRERQRPDVTVIDPQYKNALWSLSAFTGIGPGTAEALLSSLGSIKAISDADVKELQKADGVGPKLAQSLYDEMREEWRA
ncbi:hypothetical protein LCGC14_0310870 [marine sediment metagenome]|uniref:ERCC4 domain-containing protein n=1 Tax=marine sediment metagenome TaxID=412755 RepID=A0A0F9TSI3_9ZZZZ